MTPELFYGNFASDSEGRLYARGGLRDCLSVWGSHGPYDINTASPALMEAFGIAPSAVAQILARRYVRPFHNMGEVQTLGIAAPGLIVGGNLMWTLRATARLRRPDGSPSDVVRTSAATVKLLDRKQYPQMPLHVVRYYDDAWSQLAVAPPGPCRASRRSRRYGYRSNSVSFSGLKKWVAFGSGVGIQIVGPRGAESLRIAAARVRPSGARLAGSMTVGDFPRQPAGVWGTEYAAFLRKLGLRQAVATVILPRAIVIVRPLALPGVSNKDLDSAVRFQMDGLHPYNDDDVYSAWTRLPGTSTVLVAVARKDAVERYAAPFEEAGIRVGGFTCSAAAIYSALRLFGAKPAPELLAVDDSAGELEYYGESPTRPVFSASFELGDNGLGDERAAALAASELRIHSEAEPVPLASLLGAVHSVAKLSWTPRRFLCRGAFLRLPAPVPVLEPSAGRAASSRLAAALGSVAGLRIAGAAAGRRAGGLPRL